MVVRKRVGNIYQTGWYRRSIKLLSLWGQRLFCTLFAKQYSEHGSKPAAESLENPLTLFMRAYCSYVRLGKQTLVMQVYRM